MFDRLTEELMVLTVAERGRVAGNALPAFAFPLCCSIVLCCSSSSSKLETA